MTSHHVTRTISLDILVLTLKKFAMLCCFRFAQLLFWPHFEIVKCIIIFVLRMRFIFVDSRSSPFRALSVPPPAISIPPRSYSVSPRDARATSVPPLYNNPLSPLDLLSEYEREPFQRAMSPTPIKCGRWAPRSNEVAFDSDGNLLFFSAIPVSILALFP